MSEESDAHFIRAVELQKAGDVKAALEELRATVELEPDFGLAWALMGGALEDLGDKRGAAEAFHEAVRSDPGNAVNYSRLASMLIDLEDFEKAEDAARASIRIDATAGRYTFLGVALRKQNRVDEAIEAYEAALELDPDFEEPMANLGSLLIERNPERARKLLQRALEIDPHFQAARDVLESMDE